MGSVNQPFAHPEVFDDASYHVGNMGPGVPDRQAYVLGGMLVRWLAGRGQLAEALQARVETARGTAGEVFRQCADGRLTSDEVSADADRFLRAYLVAMPAIAELGSWFDDVTALGDPYLLPDDDATAARFTALLDRRWAEWHALGCPVPSADDADGDDGGDESWTWAPPTVDDRPFEVEGFEVPEPWPVLTFSPDDPADAARLEGDPRGLVGFVTPGGAVAGARVWLAEFHPFSHGIRYRSRRATLVRPLGGGRWRVQPDDDPEVDPETIEWVLARGIPLASTRLADLSDDVFARTRPSADRVRAWMALTDPRARLAQVKAWYDAGPER